MDVVDMDYRVYEEDQMTSVPSVIPDRSNPLEEFHDGAFIKRFRLSKELFLHLLDLLPDLKRKTLRSNPLPPILQLAVTLQFYATGSYQYVLGDMRGLSQPSVSRIIHSISYKIARISRMSIKVPNGNELQQITHRFSNKLRIPNIIGAIDCTHVRVKSPGLDHGAPFVNRKGFHSLNIQMVSTSDNRIISVVARHPGSAHDSRIFNESKIKTRLEEADLQSYLLIGDQGYACSRYLLTPVRFPRTDGERHYNYHFIQARTCVERTFGILKSRFSVLGPDSRIRLKPEKVSAVVVACSFLHNLCLEWNIPEDIHIVNEVQAFDQGSPSQNLIGNSFRSVLIRRFFD